MLGQNRLWMELQTDQRQTAMLKRHDHTIGRGGRYLEVVGQCRRIDDQGMVSTTPKRARQPGKDSLARMEDARRATVDGFRRTDDARSERGANRLVPQANTQNRQL